MPPLLLGEVSLRAVEVPAFVRPAGVMPVGAMKGASSESSNMKFI